MSRYDKPQCIHGTWSTPSDGAVLAVLPTVNHDILVKKIMAVPRTAGVVGAAALKIQTYEASPTVLATLTVGTTAQYVCIEQAVAEASRAVTAGTPIAVVWDTTEGTGVGDFTLFFSDPSQ